MSLICNDETSSDLQFYLRQSLSFLNMYNWIADAYVSDFFFKKHWDCLPVQWQECLQNWTTEDLTFLLDRKKSGTRLVPPLSLLSFKACTAVYSLDRDCVTNVESLFQQLFPKQQTTDLVNKEREVMQQSGSSKPKEDELHAFFKKHVKPKKRHEIQNLSKVINLLGEATACQSVIDVGSGLGHLSRLLSFRYGLKVISVEAASLHAPKAAKFDREMEREIQKKKEKQEQSVLEYFQSESSSLPCHVTKLIHPNTSIDEFIDVIKQSQLRDFMQHCDQEHQHDKQNFERVRTGSLSSNCSSLHSKKMKIDDEKCVQSSDIVKCNASCAEYKYAPINVCVQDDTYLEHCKSPNQEISTDINMENEIIQEKHIHPHQGISTDTYMQDKRMQEQTTHSVLGISTEYVCEPSTECEKENPSKNLEKFILTGLHACGDLTATFLRFFVHCSEAKGLASVGCCYMKLSDDSSSDDSLGYPLSQCTRNIPNYKLSYAARELACHFADAYCQRLKDCPPHLRIHSYRAALEWLANQICPTFQRSAVQIPWKKTNNLDFESYVKLGLQKLGLPDRDVTQSMMKTAIEMTNKWKDVVSFYTVRLSLAPVIESIILLDRMVFLYENGMFDASTKP